MSSGEILTALFGAATLIGNVAFGAVIFSKFFARGVYLDVMRLLGTWAKEIALFLTGGSLVGSLVYSEVVGFPACILCWMSRVFMYPLPFFFGMAIWRRENVIFPYTAFIAAIGVLITGYQWVKEMLLLYGNISLPCPAVEGLPSCDKIYVLEYGYITIAMLALNAFLWVFLVSWAGMKHRS